MVTGKSKNIWTDGGGGNPGCGSYNGLGPSWVAGQCVALTFPLDLPTSVGGIDLMKNSSWTVRLFGDGFSNQKVDDRFIAGPNVGIIESACLTGLFGSFQALPGLPLADSKPMAYS